MVCIAVLEFSAKGLPGSQDISRAARGVCGKLRYEVARGLQAVCRPHRAPKRIRGGNEGNRDGPDLIVIQPKHGNYQRCRGEGAIRMRETCGCRQDMRYSNRAVKAVFANCKVGGQGCEAKRGTHHIHTAVRRAVDKSEIRRQDARSQESCDPMGWVELAHDDTNARQAYQTPQEAWYPDGMHAEAKQLAPEGQSTECRGITQ